jgi:hypothetical protein
MAVVIYHTQFLPGIPIHPIFRYSAVLSFIAVRISEFYREPALVCVFAGRKNKNAGQYRNDIFSFLLLIFIFSVFE